VDALRLATLSVAFLACIGLGACGTETTTTQTVDRPDGKASVIVRQVDGNATVSRSYRVYLQEKADQAQPDEILRMDKGSEPQVIWLDDGSLQVNVDCGQIYNFTNFWFLQSGDDFERVSVKLLNNGPCPYS
jgi:hypothetical protein